MRSEPEQICQICCTADFLALLVADARLQAPALKLLACRNCGLLHYWPPSAADRMPAEGVKRGMSLATYGPTPDLDAAGKDRPADHFATIEGQLVEQVGSEAGSC